MPLPNFSPAWNELGRGEPRVTSHDGMQALLDVIGNDGAEASMTALADPDKLELRALRAHSWLLLVNAVCAYGAFPEYVNVVKRLIELGADPDAKDEETHVTARTIAQAGYGLTLA